MYFQKNTSYFVWNTLQNNANYKANVDEDFGLWKVPEIRSFAWCDVTIYELRVTSYKLRVGNFLCKLRVIFFEFKIKITSCQSILRVASYYSRVMSYFLRVANKNYELQVMALFHLKKKLTKHSEDGKSLLPV